MSSDEVFEKVTHSLADVLGLEVTSITADSKLVGDLQASSLDVVDLLFQLKKAFGIELTLAEVQQELSGGAAASGESAPGFSDALFDAVTVRDVANWVKSRLPA